MLGSKAAAQSGSSCGARIADMSGRGPLSSLLDFAWRTAFRFGFPLARIWWRLTRPRHQGVVVAVYVGPDLLLVRCSYRTGWHLPGGGGGGGVRRGEAPEEAARRELAEENGLTASALLPAGSICGIWDGRRDRIFFFELRLAQLPKLRLDNREVFEARLTSPIATEHGADGLGRHLSRPAAIARLPPRANLICAAWQSWVWAETAWKRPCPILGDELVCRQCGGRRRSRQPWECRFSRYSADRRDIVVTIS